MSVTIPSLRAAIAVPSWAKNELWRKAKAVPSLDLRFAESKSLVDATTGANLVTFTRASSATYTDSQGVIRSAVTNLLLRSEEFNDAYWVKTNSTITANAETAPNGTVAADKLLTNTTNGIHAARRDETVLANTTYTLSFYAKAAEYTFLAINHGHTLAADYHTFFNLSTGAVGTSAAGNTATIQAVGDGWYRCSVTRTTGASQTSLSSRALACQADGTTSFAGDGTSGIYIWGAQLEQSSTVGEYVPTGATINSAPRFDHNPVTLESLGLLVEEQRTNSIRNNTMVGAVAGTPGTLPTNWNFFGVTREIVAAGTEDGIPYIDFRFAGTPANGTNVGVSFGGNTEATATASQGWAISAYFKLISGSLPTPPLRFGIIEFASGGSFLRALVGNISTPTSARLSAQRSVLTGTTGASTAFLRPDFLFTADGSAFDFTLRIGLPQLEQGGTASSVVLTSGTAVTRTADVCSISGSNLSSWFNAATGTIFVNVSSAPSLADTRYVFDISSGSFADGIFMAKQLNAQATSRIRVSNADTFANIGDGISWPGGTASRRLALAYAVGSGRFSSQGTLVGTETAISALPALSVLTLGSLSGSFTLNGTLSRVVFWPSRLPSTVLEAITN